MRVLIDRNRHTIIEVERGRKWAHAITMADLSLKKIPVETIDQDFKVLDNYPLERAAEKFLATPRPVSPSARYILENIMANNYLVNITDNSFTGRFSGKAAQKLLASPEYEGKDIVVFTSAAELADLPAAKLAKVLAVLTGEKPQRLRTPEAKESAAAHVLELVAEKGKVAPKVKGGNGKAKEPREPGKITQLHALFDGMKKNDNKERRAAALAAGFNAGTIGTQLSKWNRARAAA